MKPSSVSAGGQRDSPRGRPSTVGEVTQTIVSQATHGNVLVELHPCVREAEGSMSQPSRSERWLDVVATVLLSLATVATAWAAYQSRQWTGEQAQGYSRATAARITENRAAALANRQVQIDVATFVQWVDAYKQHRRGLAAFYRARFRDEFKPAFAAWLATSPFQKTDAPPTPFAMSQYKLKASREADRLEATAAAHSEQAKAANERGDNYMLAVVLFAASLFFAGISMKMATVGARAATLGLGCVLFLATVIWVVTFPVQLTT
jgi:hypothetical protein